MPLIIAPPDYPPARSASSASVVEGGVMSVVSTLVQHHSAPLWRRDPAVASTGSPGPQHRCSARFAAWSAKQQERSVANSNGSPGAAKRS